MTRSFIPAISLVSLACMIAAGTTHWWSLRKITGSYDTRPSLPPHTTTASLQGTLSRDERPRQNAVVAPPDPVPAMADATPHTRPPVGESLATQQQFYKELLREMQHLRSQNHDLLNQVAETNRDLMKLEFRVDTHSEQFRPLPVAEEEFGVTIGTSFDDGPGLLPPRAEPVELPFTE